MAIVSTAINAGHEQIDGRRYVEELHTDHLGVVHSIEYLAAADADTAAIAAAHAVQIAEDMAEAEAAALLERD